MAKSAVGNQGARHWDFDDGGGGLGTVGYLPSIGRMGAKLKASVSRNSGSCQILLQNRVTLTPAIAMHTLPRPVAGVEESIR